MSGWCELDGYPNSLIYAGASWYPHLAGALYTRPMECVRPLTICRPGFSGKICDWRVRLCLRLHLWRRLRLRLRPRCDCAILMCGFTVRRACVSVSIYASQAPSRQRAGFSVSTCVCASNFLGALKLATPHCCIQIFLDCVHPDPMADVLLMSSNGARTPYCVQHARHTFGGWCMRGYPADRLDLTGVDVL